MFSADNMPYFQAKLGRKTKLRQSTRAFFEKRRDFKITLASRLRYRNRYFTDTGIIRYMAFVIRHYYQFRHLFQSKNEKIPKPIQGLSGIYSLKRLSELI